jgi:shikimate kinase
MSKIADRPIALVGLMGAGKTAVAQALGERLGASIADLDAMIEAEEGCSIAELFRREGEPWFRRRETELLRRVLASGTRVIACGGGIVLEVEGRSLLRDRCHVAWIEVTPAAAARRIGAAAAARPLLAGDSSEARLAALLEARTPLYAEVAQVRVPSDGRTPAQVAEAVEASIPGVRR